MDTDIMKASYLLNYGDDGKSHKLLVFLSVKMERIIPCMWAVLIITYGALKQWLPYIRLQIIVAIFITSVLM